MSQTLKRNTALDILRVIACYLVIQVHVGEFFYIGESGSVISGDNAFWVNLYNSIGRTAVPLFVMITGYFLLPVQTGMTLFFKKRFTRVLIPFVVWCILYALFKFVTGETDMGTTFTNILKIPINFGVEVGHLWYVYMLIGIYLFAPIISPWIKSASKRGIQFYLCIWAVTLCLPYIHAVFPEVWGECFWNNTPMLYYFSGLLGYAILGYYIKAHLSISKAWSNTTGLILIIIGYGITFGGFHALLDSSKYVWELELTWGYGTINVAIMALGIFLIIKNLQIDPEKTYTKLITDISLKSYGIYLAHIMILLIIQPYINKLLPNAISAVPITSIITFIASYLVIKALSYLPKSKYIIG